MCTLVRYLCRNKRINHSGFTVLELLGSLLVFVMLIIMINQVVSQVMKRQQENQMADQIKAYEMVALKYVNDNYRLLDEQTSMEYESGFNNDVIVPWSNLSNYYTQGSLAALTNWQVPCLHISKNFTNGPYSSNNPFKAYLIFGATNDQAEELLPKDAFMITHILGGNAGVLVPSSDGFIVEGTNANNQIYSYSWEFANACGFDSQGNALGVLPYSLVIDLSRRGNYVTQARTMTDFLAANPGSDPTLQRNGNPDNLTMQTNLYLDNVVQESTAALPAEHVYRALDFGQTVNANGRIQIVSDESAGMASAKSRLDVNNAGITASYIGMASHLVTIGTTCAPNELGKMAQMRLNMMIAAGSQVECTYNPTYCAGAGYCYIPVITSAVLFEYTTPQAIGTCPTGLLADPNQPDGAIDTSVVCPPIESWQAIGIFGSFANCNSMGNKLLPAKSSLTLCSSYATFCQYSNGGENMEQAVAALVELQCTNSTTRYIINNYVS